MRLLRRFLQALPYRPTAAQTRVMAEIESDLAAACPCGGCCMGTWARARPWWPPTACLRAVEQGAQAALMAPTEVLADQHYLGLSQQLSAQGVRVGLLKGSQSAAERQAVRGALESGELDVVVGTHALIQEGVRFRDLRVAVVDEQHRFGVRQRDAILAADQEGVLAPHPAHVGDADPQDAEPYLYGDLDISVLGRDARRQAAGGDQAGVRRALSRRCGSSCGASCVRAIRHTWSVR